MFTHFDLRALRGSLTGFMLLAAAGSVSAQVRPDQLLDEHVIRQGASDGQAIELGDEFDSADGTLTFRQVDIAIPGNNALDVSLVRRYSTTDKRHNAAGALAFADWSFDLPRIRTISASQWNTSNAAAPLARCSTNTLPAVLPPQYTIGNSPTRWFASPFHYWTPASIDVPEDSGLLLMHDAGAATPANGLATKWVTLGRTSISCLSTIKNGDGEGFFAITTGGKRYRFDWLAKERQPDMVGPVGTGSFLARFEFSLYATRVEDHLGNWVEYDYLPSAEGVRLSAIRSSDSRRIDVAYDASDVVSTVSAAGRKWTYSYGANVHGRKTLTRVTSPDTSAWRYDFAGFDAAKRTVPVVGEVRCDAIAPQLRLGDYMGTVTSPAGLRTQYAIRATRFGRSNVPKECNPHGAPLHLITYGAFSLVRKTVDGPGIPAHTWSYRYATAYGFVPFTGGSNSTEIVAPDGAITRYRHGNVHGGNDGLLIGVDRLSAAGTVLESRTIRYGLPSGSPFVKLGTSPSLHRMNFNEESLRPESEVSIAHGGMTFTRKADRFDTFARATRTVQSNSAGASRTQELTYQDDPTRWVLGQVKRVAVNGIETERTEFNAQQLPIKRYAFGKLLQSLTYDTTSLATTGQLGTIATVSDGRDGVAGAETTYRLSSWKRGVPQLVKAPATPESPSGASQSAVVNDDGTIASFTDESGGKTCYAYDTGGRVSGITYPSESVSATCNTTAWAAASVVYASVATAEYGLAANHWKRTLATGNARKVTYFDAMWRPVVEESYDTASVAATRTLTVKRYDVAGRLAFESYPTASLVSYSDATLPGKTITYDALDRVTSIKLDSELGTLQTTTSYLRDTSGLYTLVTTPRGYQTKTWFQMFDEPDFSNPIAVAQPEGVLLDIARDAFGKPQTMTRRNANSSIASTRAYTYNANHELCRVDAPESKATFMGYDAAGNLAWSAAGISAAGSGCTAPTTVVSRRSDRTYDARNNLRSRTFPGGLGNTTYAYTLDGLLASVRADNAGTEHVTTSYTYNRRRLLTQERMTTGSTDWSLTYAYNTNGHRTSRTDPGGLSIALTPNALGQPTTMGAFATGISYFPGGAIKQFTYGNGIVHTLTRNKRGLPDTSTDTYGGTKIISDSYDFDGNGNVVAVTDGATNRGQRGNRTMAYDGRDRLKTVVSPMYGSSGATYAYDVLDNLARVTIGGPRARDHFYCYDARTWHLTNVKTGSCAGASVIGLAYDDQGNLKNKNGVSYTFDFGNRLRSVNGSRPSSYTYDGHGRRVRDSTTAAKYSLYSTEGQLAFDRDARKGVQHHYVYLGDSLVAIREKNTATGTAIDKYQHTDALGSPIAVTNAARTVLERIEYEPYGAVISPAASADGPGYTGHVFDSATGMNQMQQRYFDAQIGRFISVDPDDVETLTGRNFNRYWYGNNSPYNYDDPDGRSSRGNFDGPLEGFGHILADQITFQAARGEYQRAVTPQQKSAAAQKLSVAYGVQGLESDAQRFRGEADIWSRKITMRDPGAVHHLQGSVSSKFSDGRPIEGLVQQLTESKGAAAKNVLPIRVFVLDGKVYTLDHRRLYAHQAAGVPIQTVEATPREVARQFQRKATGFRSGESGRSVQIKQAKSKTRP